MTNDRVAKCVACGRGSDEIPLIVLEYRGEPTWICPQHMPALIHQPQSLVGKVPGADRLSPAEPDR
jgi:hypothetical protein